MLDRLIARDGAAKGIAVHGVVLRHFQAAVRTAQLLEGQEDGGAVKHRFGQGKAFACIAQTLSGSTAEADLGNAARGIKGLEGLARDASARQLDQEQARLAAFIGQHHRQIGNVAIGDRDLHTGQLAADNIGLQVGRIDHAWTFRGRESANQFASRDLRQPLSLLGVRTGQHQGFSEEIDRRGEGDRGAGAAQLFGNGAKLNPAKTKATMFFRDSGAQPALSPNAFPQIGVIGQFGIVQHLAHMGRGTVAIEELARLVLQKFLIVGIIEIHGY